MRTRKDGGGTLSAVRRHHNGCFAHWVIMHRAGWVAHSCGRLREHLLWFEAVAVVNHGANDGILDLAVVQVRFYRRP